MNKFQEVYEFSRQMLAAKCFENWDGGKFQSELEALFADGGPSDQHARVLVLIHSLLGNYSGIPPTPDPPSVFKPRKPLFPQKLPEPGPDRKAGWLVEYAKESSKDPGKDLDMRAAFLKMLKHFYFVSRAGNQSIWVADNPTAYSKWTYDLFKGKSERSIKAALAHDHEVFGEGDRKLFSDALTLARKWSGDVYAKMGTPDAATIELVKRWFGTSDEKIAAVSAQLKDGFKWISQSCNDTRVVFSDDPTWRVQAAADDVFAAVFETEAMQVIYVYRSFLRFGKSDRTGAMPKLWLAALTVIHELSHKRVGTKDKMYDYQGLKPKRRFTAEDAIWNADSWAYFAADVVGALAQKDFQSTYR